MPVQPTPGPLSWGPKNTPVPYAAAWSAETAAVGTALTIRPDGSGLAYRDETPADRDGHGVLWARLRRAPGTGRPDYRSLHSERQRQAMLHKLCQVCGGPADRTSRGWLFLMPHPDRDETTTDWPEGKLSTKPPVCRPCAALALRHCPHLDDPLFVRSRKPRVWGAFGGFYAPAPAGGLAAAPGDDLIPYGHPATRWFLASQLVVELTRCTRVSLDAR